MVFFIYFFVVIIKLLILYYTMRRISSSVNCLLAEVVKLREKTVIKNYTVFY